MLPPSPRHSAVRSGRPAGRRPSPALAVAACLALVLLAVPASAQRATGTLVGEVLSAENGEPLEGVMVNVVGVDTLSVLTNEIGGFRIARLPVGTHRIEFRHLGSASGAIEVEVGPGRVESVTARLSTDPVEVPGLSVEVERRSRRGKMATFHERRKLGLGHFWDREELRPYDGMALRTVWWETPGLAAARCRRDAAGGFSSKIDPNSEERMREMGIDPSQFEVPGHGEARYIPGCWLPQVTRGHRRCVPLVVLDGAYIQDPENLLGQLDPRHLEGIEVFRGPSEVPGIYRMKTNCGVVVLWTRSGAD